MKGTRESIFAALFSLAAKANTPNTKFSVMSRRFIPWSERSNLEGVELYQLQLPQMSKQDTMGANQWKLHAIWFVYIPVNTDDLRTVVSTYLNNYLDALDNAISPQMLGERQTLGGLVTNAWIDGNVIVDEGLLSPPALIAIPITILTGI